MFIDEKGQRWYKGNLHTHTTRSDGQRTPEEAAALYRENGYDFLALTDHWKVSATTRTPDSLLLLAGVEYNFGETAREGVYHIVGFGMYADPGVTRDDGPQRAVDKIRAAGGLAVLAHPAWSLNTPEHIRALPRADATEIFNSVSDLPRNCRPYSGGVLDMMAAEGRYLPLLAVDDTHFYTYDACRSYVMVRAEQNTPPALLAAIRRGDFYATQGPRLSVVYESGAIRAACSPVSSIVFFTDSPWVTHRADVGEGLTEAVYTPSPRDTFVRVEATDAEGRTAWSNYIPIG